MGQQQSSTAAQGVTWHHESCCSCCCSSSCCGCFKCCCCCCCSCCCFKCCVSDAGFPGAADSNAALPMSCNALQLLQQVLPKALSRPLPLLHLTMQPTTPPHCTPTAAAPPLLLHHPLRQPNLLELPQLLLAYPPPPHPTPGPLVCPLTMGHQEHHPICHNPPETPSANNVCVGARLQALIWVDGGGGYCFPSDPEGCMRVCVCVCFGGGGTSGRTYPQRGSS